MGQNTWKWKEQLKIYWHNEGQKNYIYFFD